eukprot:6173936-Pleurochrysis_carterae.AAC.2
MQRQPLCLIALDPHSIALASTPHANSSVNASVPDRCEGTRKQAHEHARQQSQTRARCVSAHAHGAARAHARTKAQTRAETDVRTCGHSRSAACVSRAVLRATSLDRCATQAGQPTPARFYERSPFTCPKRKKGEKGGGFKRPAPLQRTHAQHDRRKGVQQARRRSKHTFLQGRANLACSAASRSDLDETRLPWAESRKQRLAFENSALRKAGTHLAAQGCLLTNPSVSYQGFRRPLPATISRVGQHRAENRRIDAVCDGA